VGSTVTLVAVLALAAGGLFVVRPWVRYEAIGCAADRASTALPGSADG
jgi:hypothetical protein